MKSSLSKIFLAPLSWLYSAGVWLHNMLYDEHLLPQYEVAVPTICVGNLAVGGTGKTPHVEYLVRLLTAHGLQVAVLSRGYMRRTRGFLLADNTSTADSIGDEPLQIHRKFPDIAVAVCENRVRGIRRLLRVMPNLDCVILDDAFQHRRLRCGYNLLLTAYDNIYVLDHMLPWGRLRDHIHQSLRANAIVVTKCPEHLQPIDKRIIDNHLRLPQYQQLYFSRVEYDELPLEGTPLIVAGIAHPEYLLNHLKHIYPRAELVAYPDHYVFRDDDIRFLRQKAELYPSIVTTEKDYVRLLATPLVAEWGTRLHVQTIHVAFDGDSDMFDRQILRYVQEKTRKNKN